MGFLNFFKSIETPELEKVEPTVLKRVPAEKNDGRWAQGGIDQKKYTNDPEMIEKIHEQTIKKYSEIKNSFENQKN